MKFFGLVNPGFEEQGKQEVQDILNISATTLPGAVIFTADQSKILPLLLRSQIMRRMAIDLGNYSSLDKVVFTDLEQYFTSGVSFKIVVEGVQGQDKREDIARSVAGKVFDSFSDLHLDLKNPSVLLLVWWTGKEYVIGIDLAGKELNVRDYRLFAHQASFKGDLGYAIIRTLDLTAKDKLLIGFSKDGVLAIESALYLQKSAIRPVKGMSLSSFPCFKDIKSPSLTAEKINPIVAFDTARPNIEAARKHINLAGVKESVILHKIDLDELDVRFEKGEFTKLLFHLTKKDEVHLNEIYYQARYLLKSGGLLCLLTRTSWEVSLGSDFTLEKTHLFSWGGSSLHLWILKKI